MELPFKYILLTMIKMLNDRKMNLVIDKVTVINFLTEYMKKSFYTINEKKTIKDNFDFEFEWEDFIYYYSQYFDIDGSEIIFDTDYINELDDLINELKEELGVLNANDINFVIDSDIAFLEILGVSIKEELYEFLADLEKELESSYDELCQLDTFVGINEIDINELNTEIKKMYMQKTIMYLNARSLLTLKEQSDLVLYASNAVDIEDELDDLSLLLDDPQFYESDIIQDTFLCSIFTGKDIYDSILRDSLDINYNGISNKEKYSRIRFYMIFLELLDREIKCSNELINIELIRIKYRVMNLLDSIYGTYLFINEEYKYDDNFEEDYTFASDAVYYFIDELLHYDDEKYRNIDTDTDNIMVYLNNIMKKLIIETYYKLTKEDMVINKIKNNPLYGINTISSSFLRNIEKEYKTKIKEK